MRKFTFLLVFSLIISLSYGQSRQVNGVVLSAEDNSPLPGVSVVETNTSNGVVTDIDGKFNITMNDTENNLLAFSFMGFLEQEIKIVNQSSINVILRPDVEVLDDIIVVGYGTKKKSLVTGAISSVEVKDINLATANAMQSIQGKVSGVQVMPTSGSPGAAVSMKIRGTGSNGRSQPLFIVDGMKTSIDYLSPSDIESVEILKDAASSAIYGAEGANGVVIVTTKTGKEGKAVINYDFQYGIQSVPELTKMMNVKEYSAYLDEAGIDSSIPDSLPSTNWFDETFQLAPVKTHNISISGGSKVSTYLLSGTFYEQDGIVGGDKANFQRYSFRLNSTHKLKKWLEVGNNLSYTNSARRTISEDSEYDGLISSAIMMDPLTPVTYEGVPQNVQDAIDNGHTPIADEDGNYYGMSQYTLGKVSNPVALLETMKRKYREDKLTGSFYGKIKPFKGFEFTSRLGIDLNYGTTNSWNPSHYFTPDRFNDVPTVSQSVDNWKSWLWDNYAIYSIQLKKHNISLMAGMSSQENTYEYIWGDSAPLAVEDDSYAYLDHTLSDDNDKTGGSRSRTTMLSYFGRFSYDYDSKYLFETTLRRDGSSLFSPENKFAVFPSVSLGWVVSNEEFFNDESFFNHLKLRGSWGQNGSLSNLSADQWNSLITSDGIRYPNSSGGYYPGAEPLAIANKDLVWETSEQVNVGLDARFFNNKLSFVAEYYKKQTIDLLTPSTPPLSVGNNAPFANGGTVSNEGFEFELSYKDFDGEFKYSLSANFSTLKNNVTYLNPLAGDGINGAEVGRWIGATRFDVDNPIWYFRGYKTDGIFQSQDEIDKYIEDNNLSRYRPKPGEPIVIDVDGDGRITPNDRTYIGSPHPDMMYGATVYLEYKGFDFNFFLQGSIGNDVLMGFYRNDYSYTNKPKFFYDDRWTGEGSTNEWFGANTRSQYIYQSDFMVQDGSFMRIRKIQLGYSLPSQLTNKAYINKFRLYVSLDNFFTFTKYKGIDPEAGSTSGSSQGIDRGVYPIPRTIMYGVSVSF
ncbi:MAG: TonB-dependent receptor [Bacteroidota bacterium]